MIVQLVAPGTGGVRDHADALQRAWAAAGLRSETLALSQAEASTAGLAKQLAARMGAGGTLFVHYSGYGYQRRGLCFWLVQEIAAARAAFGPRLRVVTLFHELYALGPPWRSAFWLSPLQALIAARLLALSDAVATNTARHARWLSERGANAGQPWPVFSNVGEPPVPAAAEGRLPRLLVFGAESTRRRALQRLPRWSALLSEIGVDELVEVGSGSAVAPPSLPVPCRFVGRVEGQALHALFATSAFGLIDYPSVYLGKSGVFAAYAAHGCVVLDTAPPGPDADGLVAGRHYIALADGRLPVTAAARQALADANREWYSGHTLAEQALAFARLCQPGPEPAALQDASCLRCS